LVEAENVVNRIEIVRLGSKKGHKADGPEEDVEGRMDRLALGVGRDSMLSIDSDVKNTRGGVIRRRMGRMVCGQPIG
jgi:hypothetical protein